jgi:hypothetical protein
LQDQKVLGLLLSSMEEEIASQLIGCKTAAAVWASVHTMFGAKTRANIRHIWHQLQSLRKGDMTAEVYMQKMKNLADIMASAGFPVSDDELVDYIITGLGSSFNSLAGPLNLSTRSIPYTEFYSSVLSFEAMQAQQAETEEWPSSANVVSRPGHQQGSGYQPAFLLPPQGGGRSAGQLSHQSGPTGGGGGGGRQNTTAAIGAIRGAPTSTTTATAMGAMAMVAVVSAPSARSATTGVTLRPTAAIATTPSSSLAGTISALGTPLQRAPPTSPLVHGLRRDRPSNQ